jgi:hypothetical protein
MNIQSCNIAVRFPDVNHKCMQKNHWGDCPGFKGSCLAERENTVMTGFNDRLGIVKIQP